jgi:hypothetical protein
MTTTTMLSRSGGWWEGTHVMFSTGVSHFLAREVYILTNLVLEFI